MSQDLFPSRKSQPRSQSGPLLGLLVLLVAALFVLFVVSAASVFIGSRLNTPATAVTDPEAKPRPVADSLPLADEDQKVIELFKKCSKSVVHITTATVGRDYNFNLAEIPKGTGTGFMWDEQGRVVTNYHVIEGANRWKVTLADQSSWDAVLVGTAPDKDLAVLKIDAPRDPGPAHIK